MISDSDAHRIQEIGAPKSRIEIHGNAKYDRLVNQIDSDTAAHMKRLYNVGGEQPVFVAGSTREPEEAIILDVYEKILKFRPDTLLIIAPRHVNRAGRIDNLVAERRFDCQFRSDLDNREGLRTAPVVILDTIGELQATYSIASVIFCGGSLVPLGGQNILEAAVWGKPVLYGPSMEDFLDAKHLLDQTGGGVTIADGSDLADKTIYYITHPHEAAGIGRRAAKAVMSHKGAAEKHAGVIRRLLTGDRIASFASQ
jgi:3-deoxy-D-manno-octulosonic-acid transferase